MLFRSGGARDPLVVWVHEEWTPEGCTDPLRYDEARVDEIDGEIRRSWDADDGNYYGDHEWPRTLLDGHNRYEICTRLDLPFEIEEMQFDDRNSAMLWIIDNQNGRRNLADFAKVELELKREAIHRAMVAPARRQIGRAHV